MLVLAIVGGVLAVTVTMLPVLAVFVESQRVASAADAAALAAADVISGAIDGAPCTLAGTVAQRNGARLVACESTGAEASVSVDVDVLGFRITARARAGPPPDPG